MPRWVTLYFPSQGVKHFCSRLKNAKNMSPSLYFLFLFMLIWCEKKKNWLKTPEKYFDQLLGVCTNIHTSRQTDKLLEQQTQTKTDKIPGAWKLFFCLTRMGRLDKVCWEEGGGRKGLFTGVGCSETSLSFTWKKTSNYVVCIHFTNYQWNINAVRTTW